MNYLSIGGLIFVDRRRINSATVILPSSHGLKSYLIDEIFVIFTYDTSTILLYSQTPKMYRIDDGSLPSPFAQFLHDEKSESASRRRIQFFVD